MAKLHQLLAADASLKGQAQKCHHDLQSLIFARNDPAFLQALLMRATDTQKTLKTLSR
jgi:hypothetical protein